MPVKSNQEPECVEDLCAIENCVLDALKECPELSVTDRCSKGQARVCVLAESADVIGSKKINRCNVEEWQATVEIEIEVEECSAPGACSAGAAARKIASILTCKKLCGCVFRRRRIQREVSSGKPAREVRTEIYQVRYWVKPDCE